MMKALPLLVLPLLFACKKDLRDVELRVDCEKCIVDANGVTSQVMGSYTRSVAVEQGTTVALSACRAMNDTIISGGDTTVIRYNGAISIWIFSESDLALASDAAFFPDDCAAETARVE